MTSIIAFTADNVCHLTGLTVRQLGYWDRTRFFAPQYADEERPGPYNRIYSFRDVVGLRTIALLLNKHGVSHRHLQMVGAWLKERYDYPWSSLTFYVSGRKVFFDEPKTGVRIAGQPVGQTAFPIQMEKIAEEMDEAAERLKNRAPEDIGKIEKHRQIMSNAPVIAGTRIPVASIWSFHEDGYDTSAILRQYPRLTPDDVAAAIEYERTRRQAKQTRKAS